jgi:PadR family transcriptional regulator, regulatory protein AphA
MARTQRTPFVILGLLGMSGHEPRSGYEIKKVIDNVISHFWAESNGQIYPVLKRLAAQDLIRPQAKKEKGRKKICYSITPKGEASLRSWLAVPPELGKPRDELILKLFFGSQTEIPVLIGHLQAHRATAQAMLAECLFWQKETKKQPAKHTPFTLITLRAGIALSETSLRWAEESIATLQQLETSS